MAYFVCLVEAILHLWHMHLRSLEEKFQEPVLSFHQVDPGIDFKFKQSGLTAGALAHWAIALALRLYACGLRHWQRSKWFLMLYRIERSQEWVDDGQGLYGLLRNLKWPTDSSEPQRSSSRSPSHSLHGGVSIAPASVPCRWHTQCSKPMLFSLPQLNVLLSHGILNTQSHIYNLDPGPNSWIKTQNFPISLV